MDDLLETAELVGPFVALRQILAELADNFAEILPGRDHAPATDRVKPHRDGAFGEQGRGLGGLDRVGMVDAQHEERHPVLRASSVPAGYGAGGVLVRPQDGFRSEIAGAQPVRPAQ